MHRLLERQLKREIGDIDVTHLTTGWQNFLNAVNESYINSDKDRALLERSLELTSKEHRELNLRLKAEMESATLGIKEAEKIKHDQEVLIENLKKELEKTTGN